MKEGNREEKFRQWALEVLALLSADASVQADHLRSVGVDSDELLLQFDDLLSVAQARSAAGSLEEEDLRLLAPVNRCAQIISAGSDSIWSEEALRHAIEWRDLREAARLAWAGFHRS